ncbi:MAG TPA: hypothetical protein VHY32_01005 [Caulobacteraceae bacterium]|jgi:hypothetical protein|nr:hypothetical protein [Caulobacteraceae bacterium]
MTTLSEADAPFIERAPAASLQRRQARAMEYRGRAIEASALAQASNLDNVREKHVRAAARWNALADLDEDPGQAAIARPPIA